LATLFSDNFNRANSATVDATNWTEFESGGSTWSISGNQLAAAGGGPFVCVLTTTTAHAAIADCKASIKRITGAGFDGGPAVRAANQNSMYYLDFYSSDTVEVYRVDSGTHNLVGSRTQTHGANDVFTLQVSGTGATVTLKAIRNGVQLGADILDANAARITTAGQTGVIAWAAESFDDFLAEDLAGGGATVALDGRIGGRASTQGAIATLRSLNGRTTGQSRTVAAASILRGLAGLAGGRSSMQGAIAVLRTFAARVAGRSNTIGTFATGAIRALAGIITGRSSAQGVLSVIRGFDARVSGAARARGSAGILRGLTARIGGSSTVQSAINALRGLAGRAQGSGRAIGELTLPGEEFEPLTIDDQTISLTWEDDQTIEATWEDDRIIDGANWIDDRTFALPHIGMMKTGVKIKPVAIGDDFVVRRTYTTLPPGTVITKAWFSVKKSEKESDGQALIFKEITAAPSANGQITIANTAGGTLAMFFNPNRTETIKAKAGLDYIHDVKVLASNGDIHTLEKGNIPFFSGVTRKTS
jgi:hypothetical protein